MGIRPLDYTSVPEYGFATSFLSNESVAQATDAIASYVDTRLSRDFFLAIIKHFESFLTAILRRASQPESGTLGQLQRAVEKIYTIPNPIIEDFDEVRERRNTLMHQQGKIDAKYRAAAIKVHGRSSGWVPDPATVSTIDIPPGYLSYVADVIIRYSKAIP